jgi:fermentation-respiration switch protein FrsA (DUF1100 family)
VLRSTLRITAALLVAYAVVVVGLMTQERALIFQPPGPITLTPEDLKLRWEPVDLTAEDGTRLSAWFLPHDEPAATVLYFHGNAENLSSVGYTLGGMQAAGLQVLALDYRGYGASEGEPTEAGLYLDARAAWAHLMDRGIASSDVAIWGHSLGSGVAVELATVVEPRALVIDSAYTSMPDVAAEAYWWAPVQLVMRTRLPSLDRIPSARAPVFVAHATDDAVIPFAHGRALFDAAPEPKRFFTLKGGHNDGVDLTDGFLDELAAALRR